MPQRRERLKNNCQSVHGRNTGKRLINIYAVLDYICPLYRGRYRSEVIALRLQHVYLYIYIYIYMYIYIYIKTQRNLLLNIGKLTLINREIVNTIQNCVEICVKISEWGGLFGPPVCVQ